MRHPAPILIVGGAGFVGTELSHRLLQGGQPVRILDNLSAPDAKANLTWLLRQHGARVELERGDARSPADVARAVKDVSFIYLLLGGDEVGTLNVLEAARAREGLVPVVCRSSLAVLSGPTHDDVESTGTRYEPRDVALRYSGLGERATPSSVDGPLGPRLIAERRALSFAWNSGVPAVVLRFGELLGVTRPGQLPSGWVNDVVNAALSGWAPEWGLHPREVRDLLFIDDAVKALLAARRKMGHIAGGLFHVCGGPENAVSAADLLLRMGSPFQPPAPIERELAPERAAWRVGSYERFKSATGWSPIVSATVGASRLYQCASSPPPAPLAAGSTLSSIEERS